MRASTSTAVLLALAAAIAGCGGGSPGGPAPRPARPKPTVTLAAPGHRPRVDAPWPISIRAVDPDGRPLTARVHYQYLFAGSVVAQRSHYRFRGSFHDTIRWPARSAGVPLTFRAVVTTKLGTVRLDYPVKVTR